MKKENKLLVNIEVRREVESYLVGVADRINLAFILEAVRLHFGGHLYRAHNEASLFLKNQRI